MKKYILIFISFILILIGIDSAFAMSSPYWGAGSSVIHPKNVDIFDCSSSNCNVGLNTASRVPYSNNGIYYYYNLTQTSMPANGNGIMWVIQLDNFFKSGYLYSVTTYLCHNSSADIVYKNIYTNTTAASVESFQGAPTVYQAMYSTNFDTEPFSGHIFQKCGFVNTIIKPNNNAKFIGLRTTTSSNSNNYVSYLIGYTIDVLGSGEGLSSSDVQNVINNSGLATSSDINGVNHGISNIQSALSSAESNIIDSQEQTRDAITQNQNENTDREIESQKVCSTKTIDKSSGYVNGWLRSNGTIADSDSDVTTDYIYLDEVEDIKIISKNSNSDQRFCFYDLSKTVVSCDLASNYSLNSSINIPNNSYYVRFTIFKSTNKPTYSFKLCQNGNQAMNDSINDVNDTLNNSDISGATDDASSFFSGFTTNTFGLTSIITSPLNLINSLTSKTCTPLILQIPYVNMTMQLPCMSTIYNEHFSTFITIYQTITFGITSYWVCVRIFALVKDFKNPDHDEIEVMDL